VRGRKPKPSHLKAVAGNPGKRPLNKNEPQVVQELSDPPDWFDELQMQYWRNAINTAPKGLLGTMDREILTVWICAAVMHRKAVVAQTMVDQGKAAPMLTKTPNGMPVQSPYIGIINKQAQIMIKAAAEMGFTPSSRSRISVKEPGQSKNPFI